MHRIFIYSTPMSTVRKLRDLGYGPVYVTFIGSEDRPLTCVCVELESLTDLAGLDVALKEAEIRYAGINVRSPLVSA